MHRAWAASRSRCTGARQIRRNTRRGCPCLDHHQVVQYRRVEIMWILPDGIGGEGISVTPCYDELLPRTQLPLTFLRQVEYGGLHIFHV
ncbi:hypothetical protein EI94DRAFT_1726885 [Lactarius quietus]|nr:hypothetical protein EI94DRAFT_1726885 [Lactarius quietus]